MRIKEMREILHLIDDMPREEQLICAQRLREAWWAYDDRTDWRLWWAEAKKKKPPVRAAQ